MSFVLRACPKQVLSCRSSQNPYPPKKIFLGISSAFINFVPRIRDVAQSGLEYASGGRGVGSSNLLIPTSKRLQITDLRPFLVSHEIEVEVQAFFDGLFFDRLVDVDLADVRQEGELYLGPGILFVVMHFFYQGRVIFA